MDAIVVLKMIKELSSLYNSLESLPDTNVHSETINEMQHCAAERIGALYKIFDRLIENQFAGYLKD